MKTTWKHIRMTGEQLDRFLAANGIHVDPDGALLAPGGEKVGTVALVDEGTFLALVFEEGYRHFHIGAVAGTAGEAYEEYTACYVLPRCVKLSACCGMNWGKTRSRRGEPVVPPLPFCNWHWSERSDR